MNNHKVFSKLVPGQVWYIKGENDRTKWKPGVMAKSRPVLIISVDVPNKSSICIPLTSSDHAYERNHENLYPIKFRDDTNYFVLNQVRTVSTLDFDSYLYTLEPEFFTDVVTSFNKIIAAATSPIIKESKPMVRNSDDPVQPTKSSAKDLMHSVKEDFTRLPMAQLTRKYNMTKQQICRIAHC